MVVAYLTPQFSHFAWRKQKRREQQLELAQRFVNIKANFYVYANLDWVTNAENEQALRHVSDSLEQDALLALIWTLFTDKDTLQLVHALRQEINSNRGKPESYPQLHKLRLDIAPRLFAEALGISISKIQDRSSKFT